MTTPLIRTSVGMSVIIAALLTVSSAQAQIVISEDGITLQNGPEPVLALKQYAIGDRGPAGGFVFYVTADGLHGLESAPVDQASDAQWGCNNMDVVPAAANTSIGTGVTNTNDIVRTCFESGIAAAVAADYISPSGYYDWYLPSKDELELMYDNLRLADVGGFGNSYYWSSSEYDGTNAWVGYFADGSQPLFIKSSTMRVRAVRSF